MNVSFAISVYAIISSVIFLFDVVKYKRNWFDPLYSYLFFISLYIIPLGVRYIVNMPISGNVTYMFYDIQIEYVYAVLLMAFANVFFYIAYISFSPRRLLEKPLSWLYYVEVRSGNILVASLILFLIGGTLFYFLVSNNGGLKNFILLGYGVTEELVKSPLLASSFPILFTACFMLCSVAIKTRSLFFIFLFITFFSLIVILCILLGRRAEMAVWGLTCIIFICCLYKRIKFKFILPFVICGFLFLNFIGIIRSSNNTSIFDLMDRAENVINHSDGGYYDWIYTLIDGQFVIPFETLPVLMANDDSIEFMYGTSPIINIAQWVPRFIWEDKPYGLSRWYYERFYDAASSENEGRTFFIYSEGYLNFGILGIIIWALLYGVFWKCVSYIINFSILNKSNVAAFIGAIYVSNMIRLVAADSSPIFVTILKESIVWYIGPVVLLMLLRRIKL